VARVDGDDRARGGDPLGREVGDLTVQRRDARVLEGDRLRDEGVVVDERIADVEQRGGRRRGRAARGLEGGDVVALVDQRGGCELGELTAQGIGADRALVERQLDALEVRLTRRAGGSGG
jgi:hypothetical protein